MRLGMLILSAVIPAFFPVGAAAGKQNFFAGLDVFAGMAFGSSSTKDGGGLPPFGAADGVVGNVRFGETVGVGGHVGYRFDPAWSASISYHHIFGDIRWDATFPAFGSVSRIAGDATSDVLVANVIHMRHLSDATALSLKAGLGVGFNRLSDLVETRKADGHFISNVAGKTKAAPVAQIGAGVLHSFSPNATIGFDALLSYAGGFETGSTRRGNLGVTGINPYRIENVWRTNLGVSARFEF